MHERLYLETIKENKAVNIQHLTILDHTKITLDFLDKKVLENIPSLEGLLMHVKYLHVLCIEHTYIEVVPESIASLKCLTYLDLECNPIKVLPECVMELYNLQSLCLYDCEPLSELPKRLSNLVNLRHLGLSFYLCPAEEGIIKQLSQLQTLPPLELSEEGFQISELGCLYHVKGTLDIKGLEVIKSKLDAEKSKLSLKLRVEQLRLSWVSDDNNIKHEEVLDGLLPHPNLKLLSLKGYGGEKFPSWLMRMKVPENCNNGYAGTLCNLIKIELVDCGRCQQLPAMGHLPLLKWLEIRNMENLKQIGPEFYGGAELLLGNSNEASISGGSSPRVKSMVNFASLKELRLSGLGNLEEWCEPAGRGTWDGFPSVEVLVFDKCWKLKEVPNKFPVLKELIFEGMSSSKPLIKILSNKSSVSCLTKLGIWAVVELRHIPKEVGECTSLQKLSIMACPNLESISNLSSLGSLRLLILSKNDGLRRTLEGLESCKSLETLIIEYCAVETLPDLSGLSRLSNLGVRGMSKMIRQPPDWLYNLPSLKYLHIGNNNNDEEFPDISCLSKITSLESLFVYGWEGWEDLQNLPEQLQHFTVLKSLGIEDFGKVEQLPDWFGNLSSLRYLYLTRCKSLKKLPSKEAINFRYLLIEDCPLLGQALNKNGPEYYKLDGPRIEVEIINSTSQPANLLEMWQIL